MVDAMVSDGLWDPYGDCHMGGYAELCAETHAIDRAAQDAHADESYRRTRAAQAEGRFAEEVEPVTVPGRKGDVEVAADEEPQSAPRPAASARAAFKKDGTVTASNASTISDGAAAVLLMSRAAAERHGCAVLATVRGYGDAEQEPAWFTTAPSAALPKAAAHAGVALAEVDYFEINENPNPNPNPNPDPNPNPNPNQVDYFEINEAFSVVSLANNKLLGLDEAKVNVNGGAVSMGHPIGCSGARIVVTLLSVLKQNGARLGAAGICNGGGGASAIVIEAA